MATQFFLSFFLLVGSLLSAIEWSPPVTVASDCEDLFGDEIDLAVDAKGNAAMVFLTHVGDKLFVSASTRPAGGKWSTPIAISEKAPPTEPWELSPFHEPKVALDQEGNAIAIWRFEKEDKELIQSATLLYGTQWTAPESLTSLIDVHYGPDLCLDHHGNAVVSWKTRSSDSLFAIRRLKGSTRWEELRGHNLLKYTLKYTHGQLVVDANGEIAMFLDNKESIALSKLDLHKKEWRTPTLIASISREFSDPQIAFNKKGGTIAVWSERNDKKDYVFEASRFNGKEWKKLEFKNPDTAAWASSGWLSFDSDGKALLVWRRGDSYITQLFCSELLPGKLKWTEPTLLFTNRDIHSKVNLIDKAGNRLMVWIDHDTALKYSLLPRGKKEWSNPTLILTLNDHSDLFNGSICPDGSVILIFSDDNSTIKCIEGFHLFPSG